MHPNQALYAECRSHQRQRGESKGREDDLHSQETGVGGAWRVASLCHLDRSNAQRWRMLTKRLVEAGLLLGITVLDHIILGDGNEVYYSFADEQLL